MARYPSGGLTEGVRTNGKLYNTISAILRRHEELFKRVAKLNAVIENIKYDGPPKPRDVGEGKVNPFARITIGGLESSDVEEFQLHPNDCLSMLEQRLEELRAEFSKLDELVREWERMSRMIDADKAEGF